MKSVGYIRGGERNMFGTMFCQYETPCGFCTRLNKPCTAKGNCKPEPLPLSVDLRAALKIEPDNKTQETEQERFR